MKPAYEVITREIAAKGAGYLLLRRCPPQELGETLARGRAELLAAGAAELYAASADPACPLDEGRWEGFRLSHVRDMLWMERPLDQLPPAEGLTLEPLTRARGGAWLTLHNACFFDMPNSATYGLRGGRRAGGGVRAGAGRGDAGDCGHCHPPGFPGERTGPGATPRRPGGAGGAGLWALPPAGGHGQWAGLLPLPQGGVQGGGSEKPLVSDDRNCLRGGAGDGSLFLLLTYIEY